MTLADSLLRQLAETAGLLTVWRNAQGREQHVQADTLRSVLAALEIPCASEAQCRDSLEALNHEAGPAQAPALLVVRSGAPVIVRRAGSPHYRLQLEDGSCIMGTARDIDGGHVAISGIRRPGYHRLEMGRVRCTIAVVPQRCPSVSELAGSERSWVLAAQVYSLRREAPAAQGRSTALPGWEVGGDFSAVGRLATAAAAQGAAGLALSPVHAMFAADASRYSPYSPSSRLFLNVLYADPAAVFDADMLTLLQPHAGPALESHGCLDWPAIQAQRLAQLRRLYEHFLATQPQAQMRDFSAFCQQGGEALMSHARYEALHAHHAGQLGPGHGWQDWPADYRDPQSAAVRRYAQEHEREVWFHAFLQWLAARGLTQAHGNAAAAGMRIGLIADMAVGTDPRGSHAWSRQAQIMSGVSVGAPPDIFQPGGQDWGLTAFSPRALRQRGYDAFIETLRASLAHAGGLRVDHMQGLARMWLVPSGAGPPDGVYLSYPREELLDLLTLEAWRHQAVVVGENLGTVPEDFNSAMEKRGMLGMSVLWFEQQPGEPPAFRSREEWPVRTMAMVSTHDLPTLQGWWQGRDIAWREQLGQLAPEEVDEQRLQRDVLRQALWAALQDAGLLALDAPLTPQAPAMEMLTFLAGTPAALFSVALEDLLGLEEQPNLPSSGTTQAADGHPNWRRVLEPVVEDLLAGGDVPRLLRAIRLARGEPGDPGGAR